MYIFYDQVLFTNPSARAGYDTRSIFKRSLTGFLRPGRTLMQLKMVVIRGQLLCWANKFIINNVMDNKLGKDDEDKKVKLKCQAFYWANRLVYSWTKVWIAVCVWSVSGVDVAASLEMSTWRVAGSGLLPRRIQWCW